MSSRPNSTVAGYAAAIPQLIWTLTRKNNNDIRPKLRNEVVNNIRNFLDYVVYQLASRFISVDWRMFWRKNNISNVCLRLGYCRKFLAVMLTIFFYCTFLSSCSLSIQIYINIYFRTVPFLPECCQNTEGDRI